MPQFNKTERALYFSLTDNEMRLVKKYRTIKAKVYFIRLLGYFKAKQQFYKFDLAYNNVDTQSILEKYFGESLLPLSGKINFKTYYFQKNDILTLLHYQDWSSTHEPKIQLRIIELLKLYPKGHDTLRQLLNYFDTQQIVVPSYRTLQDLFTKAFSQEGDRLNQLLLLMPLKQQENLSELIERGNGINKLNTIRSDQKDFTYTAISSEVEKALLIVELYEFSKDFLPILLLSKNAIRYYADLTELQYAAFRLRRLSKPQQWLRWSRYLVIDFSHPWLKSTRQRAKCLAPTVLRPARCAERASVCLPQ
jgi:hypothetical protein